ncbi:MAG: glycosyltransferase family 4 protein [Euryarchaeota archaeon]|nr:glycosyltransferase family 4 protein [Euryarchaeota archaeon]
MTRVSKFCGAKEIHMAQMVILLSHIPNPRILKKIKTLEDRYKITLIYWDRGLKGKEGFEISKKNNVKEISVKAPQGKPFYRIIPLIKFTCIAISYLKDIKPTFIHASNFDMLLVASFYRDLFKKNTKIVYEVADLPEYSFIKGVHSLKTFAAKILQIIERKMTRKISKLILTSPFFWDEYFSKFVNKDKYLFIPNVPYKNLFSKYEKQHHDIFTIGFIGSVRYVRQLKMLIDAVDELKGNIKIFIAGSGPGYQEITEYSEGKNFIEIYGPYNYEREIVSLYEKIDVAYSVYDTTLKNVRIALPNRLYEAIVCNIPIIGAKGTVLGKFIEDNEIGITVNSEDKDELKKHLTMLSGSKKKLKTYQLNCDKIKQNYYYESISEVLLNEYEKM